jgi:hypothetical protein
VATGQTFEAFLKLGIEHILLGFDHLLFLAGLLAVARDWRSVIIVVTTFTCAHSLTLGLAAFDLIRVPDRLSESLIAGSILFVGLENLLRKGDPKARWAVTLVFGLMHGFGFANVLRDLGLGREGLGVALPLFSFNLGVEVGQLAVSAVMLPIFWRLASRPDYRTRWLPLMSCAIALAGGFWLIQRLAAPIGQ